MLGPFEKLRVSGRRPTLSPLVVSWSNHRACAGYNSIGIGCGGQPLETTVYLIMHSSRYPLRFTARP